MNRSCNSIRGGRRLGHPSTKPLSDSFEDGFATINERYIAPPVYTSAINVPDHQGTDQPTELPLIFVKALITIRPKAWDNMALMPFTPFLN